MAVVLTQNDGDGRGLEVQFLDAGAQGSLPLDLETAPVRFAPVPRGRPSQRIHPALTTPRVFLH